MIATVQDLLLNVFHLAELVVPLGCRLRVQEVQYNVEVPGNKEADRIANSALYFPACSIATTLRSKLYSAVSI